MKRYGTVVAALGACAFSLSAIAGEVTCYNDDSQDVINQDELRLPTWGGPAPIPVPADCGESPAVQISDGGSDGHQVLVDGKVVYRNGFDRVVEARVAPSGVVALRTQRGSLLIYRKSLETWYRSHVDSIRDFRMARDGGLIAVTEDGQLVAEGREVRTLSTVSRLYAAASGKLVALMSDGAIYDHHGREIFDGRIDGAVQVKLAADGTVVWLTRDGDVGSSKNGRIYDGVHPVVAFKVNSAGSVAYLTNDGDLGRDGQELSSGGGRRVVKFNILKTGAVTATDDRGRAMYFH